MERKPEFLVYWIELEFLVHFFIMCFVLWLKNSLVGLKKHVFLKVGMENGMPHLKRAPHLL